MSVKIGMITIATVMMVGCLGIVGCGWEKKAADAAQEVAGADSADNTIAYCVTDDITFIDTRDGQTYRTTKIGSRMWMAQNLNFVMDSSWCYDDKTENCDKYGRLYIWDAAMNACPNGWRLPDTADWYNLIKVAGGIDLAGKKLRTRTGWQRDGYPGVSDDEGTDEFGFSALPSGMRSPFIKSHFGGLKMYGAWWNATMSHKGNGYVHNIKGGNDNIGEFNDYEKNDGLSVRCVCSIQ